MADITLKKFEQERNIVRDLPPFTQEEFEMVRDDLIKYFEERPKVKNFMLLSNELRYYTIFSRTTAITTAREAADRVLTFLQNDSFLTELGELKVLKRTGEDEIEIWIGETPFLLFDADSFFVEI
jgi:hypothetical protein